MRAPWNSKGRSGDGDWHRVAVYGYGASGCAATAFLRARDVEVLVLDRRAADELDADERDPGIRWHLGEEPGGAVAEELLAGLDAVVVSPGVPSDRPLLAAARAHGLPVIAEVELAFPFLDGRVVAITGSNGKSTTTAMTGAMLRQAGHRVEVCGNIGVPLSSVIDDPDGDDAGERFFVVELSSFQLEGVELFRPVAAALLNLSDDHLDRHRDLDGYRAAKARIFMRQEADDVAVLNADDPQVANLPCRARRRFFSRLAAVEDGCRASGQTVLETSPGADSRPLFATDDVPVAGPHNLENAMAAALLARACGVEAGDIATALRHFHGLPHRLERVAEHRGVTWYDDSKGTNVGATLRSLEGFADGTVHLILGGRNKGADFRPLRPLVAKKAHRVYLIGEASGELEAALGATQNGAPALGTELVRAETLQNAVRLAAGEGRSGDVVLLSPACASFDQFRSFAERGEVFKSLVLGLTGGGDG